MKKFFDWFDKQSTRMQYTIAGVGIFCTCFLAFGLMVGLMW